MTAYWNFVFPCCCWLCLFLHFFLSSFILSPHRLLSWRLMLLLLLIDDASRHRRVCGQCAMQCVCKISTGFSKSVFRLRFSMIGWVIYWVIVVLPKIDWVICGWFLGLNGLGDYRAFAAESIEESTPDSLFDSRDSVLSQFSKSPSEERIHKNPPLQKNLSDSYRP